MIDSVGLALRVLERMAVAGPIGVSALARVLNEPKTTVHRSLESLHEAGWIQAVNGSAQPGPRQRLWSLSPRLLSLGRRAGLPRLRELALPIMDELRNKTRETIHLMVPHDERTVVLVERLDSPQPLRIVRALGGRSLLHVASNGKAVLAQRSASELEAYLARPLKASTPNTIVDPDALRSELARVRACGYAVSLGELDEGVRAVASAIVGPDQRPLGSLSISCPAQRLPDQRIARYGALVRAAAKEVSRLVSGG
ncbi:MAG: hypothetical protein RLZZ450_3347 [Pseudomonadota bacterium]|jgi:IclR family acetate operon transcriptional repressor